MRGDRFVGRTSELAAGRTAWQAAVAGERQVLLLAGEPGVGKTRLAAEITAGIPAGSSHWGRSSESGGAPALWPWIQVLRGCLDLPVMSTVRSRVGDAALVVEDIALHPQGVGDASSSDGESRFGVFDAVARLLFEVSVHQPLLIVLDDLHAADVTSLQLAEFVARSRPDARLFLIGTYRTGEVRDDERRRPLLATIGREGRTAVLDGLDAEEVVELAEAARPDLGEQDALLLHRWTGGNPLFLEELLRTLPEDGLDRASPELVGRSLTVEEAIRRRVDRLPIEVGATVRAASILGRTFDVRTLTALVPHEESGVRRHIQHGLGDGILQAGAASDEATFRHDLVRAVLYEELPSDTRISLHAAAAAHLAEHHQHEIDVWADVIAHHHLQAGDEASADAGRYLQLAGELAMARYAYEEADERFARALAIDGRDPDARRDLMILIGAAQRRASNPRAESTLLEAADLARDAHDGDRLAMALITLVGSTAWNPYLRADAWIERMEEALELCPPRRDDLRAQILGCLASQLSAPSDAGRRREVTEEAVALVERGVDDLVKAEVLLGLCATIHYDRRADHAALMDELLATARRLRRASTGAVRLRAEELELFARRMMTALLLERGDIAGFEREAAYITRAAEELNQPQFRFAAACIQSAKDQMLGRMDAVADGAVRLLEIVPEHPVVLLASFVQSGWALHDMDRSAEIRDQLLDLLQAMPRLVGIRLFLAMEAIQNDRREEARGYIAPVVADLADLPFDAQWLSFVTGAAGVLHDLDDPTASQVVYDMLAPHADAHVVISFGQASCYLGSVQLYLGMGAAAAGEPARAVDHLEASLAEHDRVGAFAWSARSRYQLALALRRHGSADASDWRAHAEAAARQIEHLPMAYLRRRIAELLAETPPAEHAVAVERDGDGWIVRTPGGQVRLRHLRGFEYLARLVRAPGQEIAAADLLLGSGEGGQPTPPPEGVHVRTSRAPVLDEQAKAAYKRHLTDLDEDICEAETHHDDERVARLRLEREQVIDELKRAAGLGGRSRSFADDAEKARVSVTKAIKRAIDEVEAHDAPTGEHLRHAVATGNVCSYRP